MATDSEKPVSELTESEAYLRFIATGDNEAFGRLYQRLHAPATGYAWTRVKYSDDLKDPEALVFDSVHDAFHTIVRQHRGERKGIWSPDGGASLSTWFKGIVRNEVKNRLRLKFGGHKETRRGDKKEQSVDKEGNSLVEQHADKDSLTPLQAWIFSEEAEQEARLKAEEAEALRDCVNDLDETPRDVIQMTVYEGKNLREIAEHVGWLSEEKKRPMTERVYRFLNAARKQLAECMDRKGYS